MARYKLPSCVFADQSGNVINEGTCSVFLAGTSTAASIYAASSGGVAVNSVESDSAGQCTWYIDTSDYATSQKFKVVFSKTNFTSQTYPDVVVFPEVTLTGTETLTNKTLTLPQINDTSADHQYVTAVSELSADRTVTFPLLTGNDEYVFKDHTQTFTNKTLTTPIISSIYQDAGKTKLLTVPNTANDTLTANDATQTLTSKTLTTPVIVSIYQDAGKTKLLTIPDTASDTLTANDATQTLTNKTLTIPTIGDLTNIPHSHINAATGGVLTGMAVQVVNVQDGAVNTGTTQFPGDDTIPQITEGDEYMTLAITPTSATNKLLIEVEWNGSTSNTDSGINIALFQDATANALAASRGPNDVTADTIGHCMLRHYMTTGTTSSTTFRIRVGTSTAGTTTFNGVSSGRIFGGVMASSITITEIQT